MADGPSSQAIAPESSSSGLPDVAHRLPFVAGPDGEEQPDELPEGAIECSICLQSCIHPVKLPCSHIFCFLCVKGVANHSKRCALCRSEIPPDFLLRPKLLNAEDHLRPTQAFDGKYQWFYEGVHGWWQYDVRASTEIEDRYQKGERIFEMLIAGFLYMVDMENMVQYRRNTPSRRRRIKRDLVDIPDKKGVAGLSCKVRPPRRTGGDGGERRDGGSQAPTGGAPGAASNSSQQQVSSLQQQMQDLTLVVGDGGTNVGPPVGTRIARTSGNRVTAADGVDRAVADVRVNPSTVDTGHVSQTNPASRSGRASRRGHVASVTGQPNEGARVNRVNAHSVNGQSALGSRADRRDIDGLEGNGQRSTSARINSQVSSTGPDTATSSQSLSMNSRGNRINSPAVDLPANRQPEQGIRASGRSVSQRVEVASATENRQPISTVGVNQVDDDTVASRASQPVVSVAQNSVDATARSKPSTPDEVNQASSPDPQAAIIPAHRRIEGQAEMDRTDHVDGSSDSD